MITHEEIRNLAHLARIDVTDAEVAEYAKDFESILGYVEQINNVDVSAVSGVEAQTNMTRQDVNPHETGHAVEKLLAEAPATQDGYYKMPKIL
jgi:aspartyl-tRNA(Asn)/glutamyl-tRNA(Gln) amidotransferase subunit C